MAKARVQNKSFGRRSGLMLFCVAVAGITILSRLFYLQIVDRDFLAAQGNDRFLRTAQISAHRGSILDRHGEPLAVSTPVDSIWVNPHRFRPAMGRVKELAAALGRDEAWLARRVTSNMEREFVYLRRHSPKS